MILNGTDTNVTDSMFALQTRGCRFDARQHMPVSMLLTNMYILMTYRQTPIGSNIGFYAALMVARKPSVTNMQRKLLFFRSPRLIGLRYYD